MGLEPVLSFAQGYLHKWTGEAGIKPPTLQLMDNLLLHLRYSQPNSEEQ